jgi:hypothetical protein
LRHKHQLILFVHNARLDFALNAVTDKMPG